MIQKELVLGSLLATASLLSSAPASSSPNIIYILADDVGFGDISAMTSRSKIHTPNIDAIAENGIRFMDAHSNSAVCTPSRYSILTGRYSWRSSLKEGICWGDTPSILEKGRPTIGNMLQSKGYSTACIGKWHVGWSWGRKNRGANRGPIDFTAPISEGPLDRGFDYFYGTVGSTDIPPYVLVENNRVTAAPDRKQPKGKGKKFNIPGLIGANVTLEKIQPMLTDKALQYLDEKLKSKEKFFLYFPLTAAHAPILPTKEFQGKSGLNEYADFVLMIDDIVGKIRKKVRDYHMEQDTIIIFTSDNGCAPTADFRELKSKGHNPSDIYRGRKFDLWEGGHRIPYVMEYPRLIKPGQVSHQVICQTDLYRTLADIVGAQVPDNAAEDSVSHLPILQGIDRPVREALVHTTASGAFSLRKGDWKVLFQWRHKQPELSAVSLYNLKNDPSEEKNVAVQNQDKVEELRQLLCKYIQDGRSTPGAKQPNTAGRKGWPQLQAIQAPISVSRMK